MLLRQCNLLNSLLHRSFPLRSNFSRGLTSSGLSCWRLASSRLASSRLASSCLASSRLASSCLASSWLTLRNSSSGRSFTSSGFSCRRCFFARRRLSLGGCFTSGSSGRCHVTPLSSLIFRVNQERSLLAPFFSGPGEHITQKPIFVQSQKTCLAPIFWGSSACAPSVLKATDVF